MTLSLPVVVGIGHFTNILIGETHIFLFKGFAHLAHIDEKYLLFTVTIMYVFSVTIDQTTFLIRIDNPKRNGNISRVKEVTRQYYNCFHQSAFNHLATDFSFCTIGTQRTVGQNETCHTVGREFAHHIENPSIVGIRGRRHVITIPTRIVRQLIVRSPVFLVERRISHNEIGFQIFVTVIGKGVGGIIAQVGCDTTNSKVHLGQFKSGLGIFLSIHRHLATIAMMTLHKLHRLHKHTARTATRVVDFTFVGFNHFGYQIDYRFGRIKFPLTFSFFNGKLG